MKIITIANDTVEYTLLKANYGGEVFMTPAQINGREILSEYLANCRKVDAEETFLIICDAATGNALDEILNAFGMTKQTLILFGLNHFEIGVIHRMKNILRLQKQKGLEFFRALYGELHAA